MNISDQIKENLEDRRKLNPNDDFGIERNWEKLTNILSENEDETINYLKNCSKEEVSWISEVFDDVSEKLQSKKFIACLRELDQEFPDLKLTFFIDNAENYIKED